MAKKKCKTCGDSKDTSEFRIHTGNKKIRAQCNSCYNTVYKTTPSYNDVEAKRARMKIWRLERGGKDLKRDYNYKKNFGISLSDYNKILDKQNERCAICGKHQIEFKMHFAVDHCHNTNTIRGLLCSNCNNGLGRFKDDIKSLEAAIKYLKRSQS